MQFEFIILAFIFLFGLMAGSFLNVVIYRLEDKKRKTLGGRSFCPHCDTTLRWYDMFPVFSWLALGGKCRDCRGEISAQYPLVELSTGSLFTFIAYFFLFTGGFTTLDIINVLFWLVFSALLVVIFAFDVKHQIIPDEAIYPALVLAIIYVMKNAFLLGDISYLGSHLLAGLIAGGFFYLMVAVSKGKWMGGGDIKLAAFMGLALGGKGVIVALYVAFILGAVVGLFLMAAGKKKMGSKIAFGPFLIIGTFTALFFAEQLLKYYVSMIV